MKNTKKKILNYIPSYKFGGIESFTLGINEALKDDYDFYYLIENDIDDGARKRLEGLGAKVIRVPNMTKEGFWKHIVAVRKILKKNGFNVVHVHDCNNRFFVMFLAAIYGVKKRIYHVHSRVVGGKKVVIFLKKIGLRINVLFSTACLSCSSIAAKEKRIKKYKVVHSNVDVLNFAYSKTDRLNIRRKYNVSAGDFVILFVGRVEKIKNVDYLLLVLREVLRKGDGFKLMVVGDGAEMHRIESFSKELGLENNVIYVASQEQVAPFYSAGDLLCLPSLSEGYSMVLLEAQASGLRCFASTQVPKDVNLSGEIEYLDIGCENLKVWSEKVMRAKETPIDDDKRIKANRKIAVGMENPIDIMRRVYG